MGGISGVAQISVLYFVICCVCMIVNIVIIDKALPQERFLLCFI
jgi:hypothetical protein